MELKTIDGQKIAATYYKSGKETRATVILLHMLGRNRGDWLDFAKKLQFEYNCLAIDFRGHGDSSGDVLTFTEKDYNNFKLDLFSAMEYIEKSGNKVYAIIGASIGANIALIGGFEKSIGRICLLSPGLDYRGVKTVEIAKKYSGKAFLVASEDDIYSANATRKLFEMMDAKKQIKIYKDSGHGTKMLPNTDLSAMIIDWLKT